MQRILVLFSTLLVLTLAAQADQETLLGGNARFGGFGGPGVYYTDYMGEATALVGGQGAFLIDGVFYLGCAGYGFGRQVDAGLESVDGEMRRTRFEGGYGGVMLGAILYNDRLIHGTADVLVGGGAISKVIAGVDEYDWEDDHHHDYVNDGFFTVQPMVHAEVNVVRWMRVDLGAGYRFVSDVEKFGLNNDDVAGPVAGVGLRFGSF